MHDIYIADPGKRKDIHASLLRASIEELKGLPPALIQVAANDTSATKVRRARAARWLFAKQRNNGSRRTVPDSQGVQQCC